MEAIKKGIVESVLRVIEEQPEAISNWIEDRVYFEPHQTLATRDGAYVFNDTSVILIPAYNIDQYGIFTFCKKDDVSKEAQERFDNAERALLEALGHSIGTGLAIECAPLAILEGYNAVKSWQEAAREYNAGKEIERNQEFAGTAEQRADRYGAE